MDIHSKTQRRRNMAAIKQKDTKPELRVRRLIHRQGYRYRLHVKGLPGRPDLVFQRRQKVVFVHGCFWHMHDCRYGAVQPKTNAEFWRKKREANVVRDDRDVASLQAAGWHVLVVWECETKDVSQLESRLKTFLGAVRYGR